MTLEDAEGVGGVGECRPQGHGFAERFVEGLAGGHTETLRHASVHVREQLGVAQAG